MHSQTIKRALALVLVLFMCFMYQARVARAYDAPWDSGHNTTTYPDPPPDGPPGPDPGPPDPPDPPDPPPPDPPEPPDPPPKDPPEPPKDKCKPDCNNTCKPDGTKSPVYVDTGDFTLGFVDLDIAGVGPALRLSRVYHSQERFNGPFGYGWVSNLTAKLIKTESAEGVTVIIRQGNGVRLEFDKYADGTYVPTSSAVTDTLTENPDGTYFLNCPACSAGLSRPSYLFNAQGNLEKVEDILGNSLTFNYDANGALQTATSSASGRSLTFTVNDAGKIATVKDDLDRQWTYTYDLLDNLVSVSDPLNYSIKYTYDENHNLVSVVDKNGNTIWVITYDDDDKCTSYGRPGAIFNYEYFNGYTEKTDPLNNKYTYYFDSNGNVTKSVLPDGTEILTEISANVWPSKITDGNGGETTYTYNSYGQILTETDALGHVTTYTYDPVFQKIATKTDARGNTWTNTYDDNGNLIELRDPLSCTTTFTWNSAGQMLTRTDGENNTWTYTYDDAGNQTSITNPDGEQSTFTYDDLGRMVTKTDFRGNTWTTTYDLLSRVTDIEDPDGNHQTFTYDGNGNRVTSTDPRGATTTFTYDVEGRKTSITDSLGNSTTFTYDVLGNLLTETDPRGNTKTWTYNERKQKETVTDAFGTTSYTYDPMGRKLTMVDARNKTWSYTYDLVGNLLTESDPLGNTISYEYDGVGNRVKTTDGEGNVTYYEYDAVNNQAKVIIKIGDTEPEADEDDIVSTRVFNCIGQRISETNPLGETTVFNYDFRNNVITETNSLGEIKAYSYDENGNKLSFTTVTGNVIQYTYDKLNRLKTVGDASGLFETYEYDANGNKTKITVADGAYQTVTYTPFNKPETLTDARGNTTSYVYDEAYNLVKVTNRLGLVTTQEYDAANRLVSVTDPLSHTASLEFDAVGAMVRMTDDKGAETEYIYDDAGRLRVVEYADGSSKSVAYNGANQIISKTDQNGTLIQYERDEVGRITSRIYPDSSQYDYTYDALGRLLTATNNYGTVTMTYDAAGRILSANQAGTLTTYSHNVISRTRTINHSSGVSVVEAYTLRDKLESVGYEGGATIASWEYDSVSRPITRTLGNGLEIEYSYNQIGWITGISHKNAGSEFLGALYGYDHEGNRLYALRTDMANLSQQFTYDNAQRLTEFRRGPPNDSHEIPSPDFQKDWTLDSLGNWTSVTTNSVTENRTPNVMSQYTDVGGTSYSYDSNGNLISDGVYTYTYDYENQLTKVTRISDSQVMAEFTVDALNRRVKKVAGGVTTEYIYDDSRVIEEKVSGVVTAHYVYGMRLDEPVLMHRGVQDLYYHADVLGSTIALTDSTGAVVETYRYTPYGQVSFFDGNGSSISQSNESNPFLFTGQRYDEETGLYYYRARYLHPELGRFLNPDPKGFVDGMNLYEYAMSNPARYVDPRGTATEECSGASFSFDGTLLKKYLPDFIAKRMGEPTVAFNYKACKKCCGEDTKHKGEYRTDKELSLEVSWSGDTGYIQTPWGVSWDIDNWLFTSKGFIGLVAQVSWGVSGSVAGATDNCNDSYSAKGCINGSLTLAALFGAAMEEKDSGWVKAHVSGSVTGAVNLCLEGSSSGLKLTFGGSIGGAIKGTVGIWKFTYEQTFYEINRPFGPLTIFGG